MKALLLIPSVLRPGPTNGEAPMMDYHALARRIRQDGEADMLDYAAVDASVDPVVSLFRRMLGRDTALAVLGFRRLRGYDVVFTNGENVGIPLALLLKSVRRRPGHVTIGHRLSTGKKRLFFSLLKVHDQIDRILLYATRQKEYAQSTLGLPAKKLRLIAFQADQRFFHPTVAQEITGQICAAGLEWRDYPTLIEAVGGRPDVSVKLAAASPWSKHVDETEGRTLPANVDARRYDYAALRDLYARSQVVIVPLYETDFQAGITTILEAMAMGKPVVATRTTGQTDSIIDGVNGVLVPVGDAAALREAIDRLLCDANLRETLGRAARAWVEDHATLDLWVEKVVDALRETAV